jgi:hypothetical protein
MDLRLFASVLGRFKVVVGAGFLLAVLLAFLSFAKVNPSGSPHFSQRGTQQWASYTTVFVTQHGFPWGRVNGDPNAVPPSQAKGEFANPSRFIGLAALYANLADSDPVLRIMKRSGKLYGKIEASPLTALNDPTDVLPLISIVGLADTGPRAVSLVARATNALMQYVEAQQNANGIAAKDRIELDVVKSPTKPKLLSGPSKTLPILVFLVVMAATCALAFILENLRPRVRVAPSAVATPDAPAASDAA